MEVRDLIRFLRTLNPREGAKPVRATLALTTGASLAGVVLNQGIVDLQLLGDDRKIHLIRKTGNRNREVTSQADWPSYNGQSSGSRYSTLAQITKSNVGRMVPKWIFGLPNTPTLQVTPVVVDGVMYVTSANQCYALDAG
jgi:alcohol dehydrogenase (cytochrome c)